MYWQFLNSIDSVTSGIVNEKIFAQSELYQRGKADRVLTGNNLVPSILYLKRVLLYPFSEEVNFL